MPHFEAAKKYPQDQDESTRINSSLKGSELPKLTDAQIFENAKAISLRLDRASQVEITHALDSLVALEDKLTKNNEEMEKKMESMSENERIGFAKKAEKNLELLDAIDDMIVKFNTPSTPDLGSASEDLEETRVMPKIQEKKPAALAKSVKELMNERREQALTEAKTEDERKRAEQMVQMLDTKALHEAMAKASAERIEGANEVKPTIEIHRDEHPEIAPGELYFKPMDQQVRRALIAEAKKLYNEMSVLSGKQSSESRYLYQMEGEVSKNEELVGAKKQLEYLEKQQSSVFGRAKAKLTGKNLEVLIRQAQERVDDLERFVRNAELGKNLLNPEKETKQARIKEIREELGLEIKDKAPWED